MGLPKELKPLYANLKRIGFDVYIGTENFNNLLLELDLDEEWKDCLSQYETEEFGIIDEDYEYAFFDLMESRCNALFSSDYKDIMLSLILDFTRWETHVIDIGPVYQNLQELNISRGDLRRFIISYRSIRDTKPVSSNKMEEFNPDPNKVFIVHGRDKQSRLELEKFIRDDLNMIPVVLEDQLNESFETIIDKLVRVAEDCLFTVVLMTPDDETSMKMMRARQNVIFELGYFLGRYGALGDGQIVIISNGSLEVPSDISGVLYYQFNQSITEVFYKLSKQFESWQTEYAE